MHPHQEQHASRGNFAHRILFISICALASAVASTTAGAAAINYGNFQALPLTFNSVIESSGTDAVPLFGSPTAFSVGLDFDPGSFTANATSGQADITDGQLNFRIESTGPVSYGFRQISIDEFGDYTLVGSGAAGTSVTGGVRLFATVREVNEIAITPFTVSVTNYFTDDLSSGSKILSTWSNNVFLDLGSALMSRGFGNADVVTLADMVLDNSLIAISELSSVAFIAKKDFVVSVTPQINPVPLPASIWGLLSGIGLLTGRAAVLRHRIRA